MHLKLQYLLQFTSFTSFTSTSRISLNASRLSQRKIIDANLSAFCKQKSLGTDDHVAVF